MKYNFPLILSLFALIACETESINFPTKDCFWRDISSNHPHNLEYQEVIDQAVLEGIPGISLLIDKAGEDIWISSSGVSRIEQPLALEPCNIMPAGSVGKLFCGAAAMLMVEDGLLDLESTIDNYLPKDLKEQIPNAQTATIAHLLSHTSGIPDYADRFSVMLDILNNKNMDFSRETILEDYVYGKSPKFSPGQEYSYSNSNYEILTIIMDQVYPKGHVAYYSFRLFSRLGLNKTFYKDETDYFSLYDYGMANGYFDRHSDGRLENATDMSLTIASGQTGSGGVVTNVVDLHKLLKSILEADLICQESLELMKEYIKEKEGFQTYKYGLGLVYRDHEKYGMAIGHPGSLPGYTTEAWYFPDQDTYIIYQINAGNILSGPVQRLIDEEFREAVLAEVFAE